jgi:hypothetical protein
MLVRFHRGDNPVMGWNVVLANQGAAEYGQCVCELTRHWSGNTGGWLFYGEING